jgi:hypothetical protein
MIDIIGKRYWYFALSLLVIVPGLISLALYGLPLAIDYTGGSMLELRLPAGAAPSSEEVIRIVGQATGFPTADIRAQPSLQGTLIIRTREMDAATQARVMEALRARYGDVVLERFESVGPTVGAEVTRGALVAVAMASLAIMLYLTFAFRQVPHAFRYGAWPRSWPCCTMWRWWWAPPRSSGKSSGGRWTPSSSPPCSPSSASPCTTPSWSSTESGRTCSATAASPMSGS